VASWEVARECLRELLRTESNPEPGVVTLSNVKRLFRSRFQVELSETSLGHSRLFDLLQDVRFRDVCVLQSHKNGQLLVKQVVGPQQVPCHQLALPPFVCATQPPPLQTESLVVPAPASPAGSSSEVWSTIYMGSVMYPTMSVQSTAPPPTLSNLRQVEVDLGMDRQWLGAPQSPSKSMLGGKSQDEDSDDSTDSPHSPKCGASSSDEGNGIWSPSSLELQAEAIRAEEDAVATAFFTMPELFRFRRRVETEHVVKNTFIEIPSQRTLGASRRACSVPRM